MLNYLLRHIILKPLAVCLVMLLPGLLLGGCIDESADCPAPAATPGKPDDGTLNLQFAIATRGDADSRADYEEDRVGSAAENYINLNDLQFYLFDGDDKFLRTLSVGEGNVKDVFITSNYSLYIFHAPINEIYFDSNITKQFKITLVALANGKSMGMTYPTLTRGTSTVADLLNAMQQQGNLLTSKPLTAELMKAVKIETASPHPTPENPAGQRIPMAGVQTFTVDGPKLAESTEALPYNLTANGKNINMLRALAKIEVIDHIGLKPNEVFDDKIHATGNNLHMRIESVEINGLFNLGSIAPTTTIWGHTGNWATTQIEAPTLPGGASYQNPPVPMLIEGIFDKTLSPIPDSYDRAAMANIFVRDDYARSLRDDNCPVYSCYIYEYGKLTNSQQAPYLRVTTPEGTADDVKYPSRTLPVYLCNYTTDGKPETDRPLTSMLRNHIYRYQINDIETDPRLTVVWTVCEMYSFTIDIPTFN